MDPIKELEERLSRAQGVNVGLLAIVISLYAGYARTMSGERNEAIATIRKGLDASVAELSSVDERQKADTTVMVQAQLMQFMDQAEHAVREILGAKAPKGPTRH
jgi:hypothetical protein